MKKIVVDQTKCIGCGICIGTDPEHFDYSDTGQSTPKSQENLESEKIMEAMAACPVAAITLEEKEEN